MKAFRSIRWRLQAWYGLLFVLALGGFSFTAYQYERSQRLLAVDEELLRRAGMVSKLIGRQGPPGHEPPQSGPPSGRENNPPPEPRSGPPSGSRPGPPRHNREQGPRTDYVVSDPGDIEATTAGGYYCVEWIDQSNPRTHHVAAIPPDIPHPEERATYLRTRDEWREVSFSPLPDHSFVVGRSLAPEFAELHRLAWKLIGADAAVMMVCFFGGWWIGGRALRPIRDISDAAEKISAGDLSQRIDTADTDSELGHLAAVLNSTFARLRAAFAQQARFTADAAHELRTPVTVMLTHTQNALGSSSLSNEHREAFEACERAAQRMRRLIESLLKLARLDAGQETIPHDRVDLAKIARDTVELVQPLIEDRGLTLHTDLTPAICFGHAGLLGQVVTNLVANAIHHHDKKGEIRVATRIDGERAVLTVSDDGPGISPEHLPQLFERFYRVDKARSSRSGGTGLGLAISRAIVTAHRGDLRVASEVGRGSMFTVELPAASEFGVRS